MHEGSGAQPGERNTLSKFRSAKTSDFLTIKCHQKLSSNPLGLSDTDKRFSSSKYVYFIDSSCATDKTCKFCSHDSTYS